MVNPNCRKPKTKDGLPRAPDEGAAGSVVELEMDEGAAGAALAPEMGEDLQEVHRPFETVIQDRTFGDQVHGPPHVSTPSQSEPPTLLTSGTLGFPTAMTRVEQLESLIKRTEEVEAKLRDWGRIVLQDLLLAEDITITNKSIHWPRKHPSQVTNNQRGGISSKCLSSA